MSGTINRIIFGRSGRLSLRRHVSLDELAAAHYGKDDVARKPAEYFQVYESTLADLVARDIKILELGVYWGASLLVWREYFRRAIIVGLDVKPVPEKLSKLVSTGRLHYIQGDQSDRAALDKAVELTGGTGFDIIIDDASHIGALSRASFSHLFGNGLKPGGYYFIEDYGTGYMGSFPDGGAFTEPATDEPRIFPSHHFGMVGWMKQLVDDMHRSAIMPNRPSPYAIASVTFWPSIALVRKLPGDGLSR